MKNKFRASWSVLSVWAKGDYNRAVKSYFKLEEYTSPQMEAGKDYHEKWQQEILKTKCLPKVFGDKKLNDPKPEYKAVVQIADWLELVGVIDCIDSPVLYEFKTGKSKTSEDYAGSWQTGIYGVLATFDKKFVDRAEIYHYDQYQKKADMSIRFITDKLLKDSLNWVMTQSGEMHNYLLQNDLYRRFGK